MEDIEKRIQAIQFAVNSGTRGEDLVPVAVGIYRWLSESTDDGGKPQDSTSEQLRKAMGQR